MDDQEISRRFAYVLAGLGVLVAGGLLWFTFAVDRSPDPFHNEGGWANHPPAREKVTPDLPMDPRDDQPPPPPPPPTDAKPAAPASQGS